MHSDSFDVIIVGGGIMGCSIAYYLSNSNVRPKIAVVERDPTYTCASTTLSMANIRIQFSLKQNVQISLYAFEKLERFADEMQVEDDRPEIGFHREGNLFLMNAEGEAGARRALKMQQDLGCPVDWWTNETIKKAYPLYEPANLLGGTFGSKDGHLDAYAVLMGYKAKAKSLGTAFIKGEVTKVLRQGKQVTGVELASGERLTGPLVINCAGAWATELAKTAQVVLPIEPVMRQVFVLNPAVKPQGPLPLTILPSGLYFRTETGGLILLGKSLNEDPVSFDFKWDDKRFYELHWPELAEFVPAFDTLKLVRGWAGLYAMNRLDQNAILGEWPELKGFYLANGFSGHGLQQAPAVGRYLSELILGLKPALDLSIFKPERILENKPLSEDGIV
jgi:glycine/D-amino acid oxidase-like deaminating enzyme